MRAIVKRRTIRRRGAVMGPLLLMMLWRHSFQSHERDPLSAQRYLDSCLELVLGGLRDRAPTEALK
jgi:hypothetical protein